MNAIATRCVQQPLQQTLQRQVRYHLKWSGLAAHVLLTACMTAPAPAPAPLPVPKATPVSLTSMLERPAERALAEGMQAYDEGHHATAQAKLELALKLGLAHAQDRAQAHKRLAFLQCAVQRLAQCEASFRAALAADPSFRLERAEEGHPLWGPVYRRVIAAPSMR